MIYDYLIVGAGFAGSVLAERLASQRDKKVLLIDKRGHIGGNAYDFVNEYGMRVHQYGPHIFHTNDRKIIEYLSQFTEWSKYLHRVMSFVNGIFVPIPINRTTINMLFHRNYSTDADVQTFFDQQKEYIAEIRNSEDIVVSKVGRELYNLLYKGYTKKHWGVDPAQLDPSVCSRIPVRTDANDLYFNDTFQMMPRNGYSEMFRKMVAHSNIHISVSTPFLDVPSTTYNKVIYTGPIDEYFGFMFGKLPYRSLRFEFETIDKEFYQPVGVVNYPNDYDYTRITEFKQISGQRGQYTTIAKEYSLESGDPYYPIPNNMNSAKYRLYDKESKKLSTVHFVGRLATYRYYNMDQVVAQALSIFDKIATIQ